MCVSAYALVCMSACVRMRSSPRPSAWLPVRPAGAPSPHVPYASFSPPSPVFASLSLSPFCSHQLGCFSPSRKAGFRIESRGIASRALAPMSVAAVPRARGRRPAFLREEWKSSLAISRDLFLRGGWVAEILISYILTLHFRFLPLHIYFFLFIISIFVGEGELLVLRRVSTGLVHAVWEDGRRLREASDKTTQTVLFLRDFQCAI